MCCLFRIHSFFFLKLIFRSDGKKMSKSLQNFPDPMTVINKYGADCLRLYLINSPLVKAEKMNFKESGVAEVIGEVYLRFDFFLSSLL